MSRAMATVGDRSKPPWQWMYTTGSAPEAFSQSANCSNCSSVGG